MKEVIRFLDPDHILVIQSPKFLKTPLVNVSTLLALCNIKCFG